MKPIRLGGICVAAIAVTLAIAVFASADSERDALDVQGDVAQAGLVTRLEAALGSGFGGVWYERSGEQLHVGVTAAADRRRAEAISAQAGLADEVTATPVDSTWEQLVAAQGRLASDLADLFARGEVSTAIAPDHNAVEVRLGAAVPQRRRSALEREAQTDGVAVRVVELPQRDLRAEKQARCAAFVEDKANCDPTMVAGVTIKSSKKTCSAGPATILQNRPTAKAKTETYLLTAGHCIQKGGGLGEKWLASDKNGTSTEVGVAVDYLNKATDVGVIRITKPAKWVDEDNIPVVPAYATWDPKAESEPDPVIGQLKPVVNANTCLSGQSSGTTCGIVAGVNVEVTYTSGVVGKELTEVEGTTAVEGDSGAPWYSNEEISVGYIEGTHVATFVMSGRPLFQPLEVSFAKLTTKLELLDETNEARHPFEVSSEATPTILSGKKSGEKETFGTAVGSSSCKGATYLGEMVGTEVAELSLTPTYSECNIVGVAATFDVNGCSYNFEPVAKSNFEASVDLVCPAGKQMEITSTPCKITIPPQEDLQTVTFANVGSGATRELSVSLNLANIAYEEHKSGILPCTSTVPKTNGTYKGSILITGATGGGSHRGIWIE